MWSMWNAPSDLDYYEQDGFSGEPPEEEEENPAVADEDDLPEPPDEGPEPPELEQGEHQ